MVEHGQAHCAAERPGGQRSSRGVDADHLDVRVRQPSPQRGREVRVDLHRGQPGDAGAQHAGGETGAWTDFEHVIAEVDSMCINLSAAATKVPAPWRSR